ncbi:MAG: DNA mismatch repair protein MutS [Desulfobacterales bacterium]|nr:DNA mismatch repair protein MutS [Desulfobacterales bacterium]
MSSSKSTPMIKQYLSIKDEYPDAILLYRMGDFYEMFFEDAERAARILEITLTSRNKNDAQPVPMCGVPYRAVQGYIARLLEKGHKVAICDQVEDPAQAKGIVKREVVRVMTPGMITEESLLDAKTHNYILALRQSGGRVGLAYLDISTGVFRLTETQDPRRALEEAQRIDPREILLPEENLPASIRDAVTRLFAERTVSFQPERHFDPRRGRERLLKLFNTFSLAGFGCEEMTIGVGAAGALVRYLKETQKQTVDHFAGIETYSIEGYLWIDERSCRNLELTTNLQSGTRRGSLLNVIDHTVTAMGARRLREWLRYPLTDPGAIAARLDAVEEIGTHNILRGDLREALKAVHDLERLASKIAMGRANARDLLAVKSSLQTLPTIVRKLAALNAALFTFPVDLDPLSVLADRIAAAIRDDAPPVLNEGGLIRSGYDAELDDLIQISRDGKGWLARLENQEREATGIGALKVRFNKVFGYFIEVPKTRSDAVPAHYVRKQTLVNAERYITDELKTFEAKVLNAEERRAALEYRIFNQVRAAVADHQHDLQATARQLAVIDCIANLAEIAVQHDYTRPTLNRDGVIHIDDGRHPVIEKMIAGERFVPNSIHLDNKGAQVLIITGPNMAGKSTILRQTALAVIMAQMGGFVPAASASIGVVDKIFTRVGALDNLSLGQSTFMVEMQETANILNNATGDSLVVLDEIGRGTSTYDGLSIAWAVAECLHDHKGVGVKTLFATHYHELTELARMRARVANHHIAVKEWNDDIIFLRKLVEGGTNRSYGIQVARLAGIPKEVIRRAKTILADIEREAHAFREPAGGSQAAGDDRQQVQLGLFPNPADDLLEQLRLVDIAQTTPLEALQLLSDMQAKIKRLPE